jgi:hypothetical protein
MGANVMLSNQIERSGSLVKSHGGKSGTSQEITACAKGGITMTPDRIEELRKLSESTHPVTLSAKEFAWLLDIHDQMKAALRGLFETHVAIDPPERGPCPECLAATVVLARIDESVG